MHATHNALIRITQLSSSKFIRIYTDCLSSLQAIHAFKSTNIHIITIKFLFFVLLHEISIGHVLTRKAIFGNETADVLVKATTTRPPIDFALLVLHSYVSRLHMRLMQQWQNHRDYSEKGRHTHVLVPEVSLDLLLPSPPVTASLTGHCPFRSYIHYYKRNFLLLTVSMAF